MAKLQNELNTAQASEVNLDILTDLVESQLGNVVGGGYSQYAAVHAKDSDQQN
jgi:hypothetical protein